MPSLPFDRKTLLLAANQLYLEFLWHKPRWRNHLRNMISRALPFQKVRTGLSKTNPREGTLTPSAPLKPAAVEVDSAPVIRFHRPGQCPNPFKNNPTEEEMKEYWRNY